MRIAFVNSKFGFWGGVEKYIYQTAALLKKEHFKICGIFESKEKEDELFASVFENSVIYNNQRINELDDLLGPIDLVFLHKISNLKLLKMLNKFYPTIILVHDHDFYCVRRHKYYPISRLNCDRPFNPIFCALCSGMMERSDGVLPVKPINIVKRTRLLKAIKEVDRFIVLSEFMGDNLVKNGFPRNRIRTLHPFITRGKKVKYNAHKPANLLYVGQIIRGKGVDLLLEACCLIKHPFVLNILGKGNDMERLKGMIVELKLQDRVNLVGFTLDVDRYYQEADMLVVPSRWQEPFGLIGTEAFNKCKPVVAFDVGGISEWLSNGENGISVAEGDVSGLARGIDYLIEHPDEAEAMGREGYDMLDREYSVEAFYGKFLNIMGELNV